MVKRHLENEPAKEARITAFMAEWGTARGGKQRCEALKVLTELEHAAEWAALHEQLAALFVAEVARLGLKAARAKEARATITFLVGGGCNILTQYVELLIDDRPARSHAAAKHERVARTPPEAAALTVHRQPAEAQCAQGVRYEDGRTHRLPYAR